MAKITLNDVGSGFNLSKINENFNLIEAELNNKVLYRDNVDGEANQWIDTQDANSNRLINLPDAINPSEPVTLKQFNAQSGGTKTTSTLKQLHTATAGQTVFTTPQYVIGSNNLSVYVNGVKQASDAYSETTTTSVTMSEGVEAGDKVEVLVNELQESTDTVGATNVTYDSTTVGVVLDAITADTVAEAKALDLQVGKKVKTWGYTTAGDGGGAEYLVVGPATGTDDGGSYHNMTNGNQLELVMINSPSLLYQLGGKWDNSTDDSAKVQIIADNFDTFYVPDGTGYVQTFPDISAKNAFSIIGSNSLKATIRTNMASGSYITPFNQAFKVNGVEIKNATAGGTIVKTGIGINGADAGAFFHNLDDVVLTGFDQQGNFRNSVWVSIGHIICQDYGTSPIDFIAENQAGSVPAGGWNVGYFNNQNYISQYLCRRGNRGPKFSGMGFTVDVLTSQEMTGDILIIESETAGDRNTNSQFIITSLYSEANVGAIKVNNTDLMITNMFAQGGTIGTPQAVLFDIDNSSVDVKQCKGQDYFTKLYDISNGSELRTTQPLGATVNSTSTEDSTSYYFDPEFVAGYHYKFDVQHSGSPAAVNYTVPVTLENQSEYELTINGLENGSVIRRESYDVFRWNSDALTSADVRSTSGSIPWTITFTGNQIRVDVNIALGLDLDITLQKKLTSKPKTL